MGRRRLRLGIRAQLTLVVLFGAVLSTAATLFIANNAIQQYAYQQAQAQEQANAKIALLVLQTEYGQDISISYDGQMVIDSPVTGQDFTTTYNTQTNFGKEYLNNNTDYVDQVQQLIAGQVSVYQCADARGDPSPCIRIASTFHQPGSNLGGLRQTGAQYVLGQSIAQRMNLAGSSPHEWVGIDTLDNKQYYTDYQPLFDPQGKLIGVLSIGAPLDTVANFQQATAIELLLLGVIILIAGVIFSVLFASGIVNTLQQAARQVSGASTRLNEIAAQQSGGAQQQVWAVNSINKALQNFAEMTRDISHRTDQLSQMGNQVIQRRVEITPVQIDSILAYMTRSVRDISVASQQESAQYERMTGAMQAVIEIAEQVAGNSQQVTESVERLDLVIGQLQQFVGVNQQKDIVEGSLQDQMDPMSQMDQAGMRGGAMMRQPELVGARGVASSASMRMNGATGGNGRRDNTGGSMGQMGGMGQMGVMETANPTGGIGLRGRMNGAYPMGNAPVPGGRRGMDAPDRGRLPSGRMGGLPPLPSGSMGPMDGGYDGSGRAPQGPMGRMSFDENADPYGQNGQNGQNGQYGQQYDQYDQGGQYAPNNPYGQGQMGPLGSGGPGGGHGMSGPSAPGGPNAPRRRMRR